MQDLSTLYELLDNLIRLHQALYTLAVQKKEILIKGKMDELIAVTRQEQKIIKGIDAVEQTRLQLVKQISVEKNVPLTEGSLSELIRLSTNAQEKVCLSTYRNELIRIVSELRDANELNQQLLEQSLSFVNLQLDMLMDRPEEDYIYKKPMNSKVGISSRTFINNKA
ncbi:flagellar protein FlgN [Brevibacillus choshinensis]|uniref:flagellar protein FlgN n=1 Tax=Brevibacillus choshinensis TaxID=54911 RepID=UPI002E207960|nr:flagellar protein FlgN [Brevibacillus choshinensis]